MFRVFGIFLSSRSREGQVGTGRETQPVLISRSMGIIADGSHGSNGALRQRMLEARKALALDIRQQHQHRWGWDKSVGPMRRSRSQHTWSLGPQKRNNTSCSEL